MLKNWIGQLIIILAVSTVAALGINAARGGGVALIGDWPSRTSGGEGPVTPPSAQEGDPPFITLEDAVTKYQSSDVVFVDSRSPEDYALGHVTRAINIPFEYLDQSWGAVIDSLSPQRAYVVYCSGGECETSLYLGRHLQELGFEHIFVFYGGWSEWVDSRLPVTRPDAPEEGGGQ